MKNYKITILLAALLFITNLSFAQNFEYEAERELAKAAFKSLQEGNLETFSTYCISESRMTKMLDEMGTETPMGKGIKEELSQEEASTLHNQAINGFNQALELAKTDNANLKDGSYPELANYETRFEVTNLKCVKVKFRISLEKDYMAKIDMFKTGDDLFIYDFTFKPGGVY